MLNNIVIYYESRKTNNGFKNYEIVLREKNNNITGYKKDIDNNDTTLLIGKILKKDLLELIEFNKELSIRNVFYGHIISDKSFYGEWIKCNRNDCDNLVSDNINIPEYILNQKMYEVDSMIQPTHLIEKEDNFIMTQENLENKLNFEDSKTYQNIKKANN